MVWENTLPDFLPKKELKILRFLALLISFIIMEAVKKFLRWQVCLLLTSKRR